MAVRTKTQALDALRGMAAQLPTAPHEPSPSPLYSDGPERMGRPGRPPAAEKTMQISLRLPKTWHAALRRRAVEASSIEDRTISPQEIVRRLVGRGLGYDG